MEEQQLRSEGVTLIHEQSRICWPHYFVCTCGWYCSDVALDQRDDHLKNPPVREKGKDVMDWGIVTWKCHECGSVTRMKLGESPLAFDEHHQASCQQRTWSKLP